MNLLKAPKTTTAMPTKPPGTALRVDTQQYNAEIYIVSQQEQGKEQEQATAPKKSSQTRTIRRRTTGPAIQITLRPRAGRCDVNRRDEPVAVAILPPPPPTAASVLGWWEEMTTRMTTTTITDGGGRGGDGSQAVRKKDRSGERRERKRKSERYRRIRRVRDDAFRGLIVRMGMFGLVVCVASAVVVM